MLGLGLPELLIILVVLVLFFGSKKLPELGDALGKGIRSFRKASEKAFGEDDSGDPAKAQAQRDQLPQGSTTESSSRAAEKKT